MNLEICIGTGISVKGVKVRCSWNDCMGIEKKITNCSEQACQTENFGVAELWDVEIKVLHEYFKVNYRAVIFSLIAFWYFFVVFVPYLTTGKLGELQLGLSGFKKNHEYQIGREFIDKCKGLEEFVCMLDRVERGESGKGYTKIDEDWRSVDLGIEKEENGRKPKEKGDGQEDKGIKGRFGEDKKGVFKESGGIKVNEFKNEDSVGVKEGLSIEGKLEDTLRSQVTEIEMTFYHYKDILSLGLSISHTGLVVLVLSI